ncbi:MAG: ABC transporter permease, partial [Nocardioides sp.]|nr:ABC transporter permease [Nocardioides sp.]
MGKYTLRRLLQMVPVLLGATFLTYWMVFALPGDPTAGKCGDRPCSEAYVAEFREKYHLNDSLPVQYGKYLANVVQGDFGESQYGVPVSEELSRRFVVTAKLAVMALAFEALIGI